MFRKLIDYFSTNRVETNNRPIVFGYREALRVALFIVGRTDLNIYVRGVNRSGTTWKTHGTYSREHSAFVFKRKDTDTVTYGPHLILPDEDCVGYILSLGETIRNSVVITTSLLEENGLPVQVETDAWKRAFGGYSGSKKHRAGLPGGDVEVHAGCAKSPNRGGGLLV